MGWFANFSQMFGSIGLTLVKAGGWWVIRQGAMTLFKMAGQGPLAALPLGGIGGAILFTVAEKMIKAAMGFGPAMEFSVGALPGLFWGSMINHMHMGGVLQDVVPDQIFNTSGQWLAEMYDTLRMRAYDLQLELYNLKSQGELLGSTSKATNIIAGIMGSVLGTPSWAGLTGIGLLAGVPLALMSWPATIGALGAQSAFLLGMGTVGHMSGEFIASTFSFLTGLGFDETSWNLTAAGFQDSWMGQKVTGVAGTIVKGALYTINSLYYFIDKDAPVRPVPIAKTLMSWTSTLRKGMPGLGKASIFANQHLAQVQYEIAEGKVNALYAGDGLLGKVILNLMLNQSAIWVGNMALSTAKYAFVDVEYGVLIDQATSSKATSMPPEFWVAQGIRAFAPNLFSIFASVKSEALPYLKEVPNISVDDLYMDWTTQRMRWQIGRQMKRQQNTRQKSKDKKDKKDKKDQPEAEKL